jgi:hypothetical protein
LVRFDDRLEKECASAMLRVEKAHMSLQPEQAIHKSQIEHRPEDEEAQEVTMDQEEEEHVSNESPDDEEEGSLASPDEGVERVDGMTHQMECLASFQLKQKPH